MGTQLISGFIQILEVLESAWISFCLQILKSLTEFHNYFSWIILCAKFHRVSCLHNTHFCIAMFKALSMKTKWSWNKIIRCWKVLEKALIFRSCFWYEPCYMCSVGVRALDMPCIIYKSLCFPIKVSLFTSTHFSALKVYNPLKALLFL